MKYRFNEYELDTESFCLSKNGKNVALKPLVFNLIIYLLENRDRLVTREELLKKLWNDREVSDATLSNHIKEARSALGDDGSRQSVIKTVHGRGYQFNLHLDDYSSVEKHNISVKTQNKYFYFISLFTLIALSILIFYSIQLHKKSELFNSLKRISKYQEATLLTFKTQAKRRDELVKMISERLHIKRNMQFEKFFSFYFKKMNNNEKFVFDQIRAMTETGLLVNNQNILKELYNHPAIYDHFKNAKALQQHLEFWLNKYQGIFKKRQDMCLLYVGVEDDVPYPYGIDDKIKKWLIDNE
ncbi:MAG TPA: hypothetical protein ENJ60_12810 [Aeromonadales bacterium]|nr:hypothetical protein [Aeromonadales bacterium]